MKIHQPLICPTCSAPLRHYDYGKYGNHCEVYTFGDVPEGIENEEPAQIIDPFDESNPYHSVFCSHNPDHYIPPHLVEAVILKCTHG